MSVLIRGMRFPKTCDECLINCGRSMLYIGITDRRSPNCPLVEIPTPHGRLGDLDALQKQVENTIQDAHMSLLWKQGMMYAHGLVETSKTVIEAEGSET